MPSRLDEGRGESPSWSPAWEPEPLHLPLYLPINIPHESNDIDDAPAEGESRVIVIDLA